MKLCAKHRQMSNRPNRMPTSKFRLFAANSGDSRTSLAGSPAGEGLIPWVDVMHAANGRIRHSGASQSKGMQPLCRLQPLK